MSLNFSHISSNVDKVLKVFLKKKILKKYHRIDSNMYFVNPQLTLIRLDFFKEFFFAGGGGGGVKLTPSSLPFSLPRSYFKK